MQSGHGFTYAYIYIVHLHVAELRRMKTEYFKKQIIKKKINT